MKFIFDILFIAFAFAGSVLQFSLATIFAFAESSDAPKSSDAGIYIAAGSLIVVLAGGFWRIAGKITNIEDRLDAQDKAVNVSAQTTNDARDETRRKMDSMCSDIKEIGKEVRKIDRLEVEIHNLKNK